MIHEEIRTLFIMLFIMYLMLIGLVRMQYWSIINAIEDVEKEIRILKEQE